MTFNGVTVTKGQYYQLTLSEKNFLKGYFTYYAEQKVYQYNFYKYAIKQSKSSESFYIHFFMGETEVCTFSVRCHRVKEEKENYYYFDIRDYSSLAAMRAAMDRKLRELFT